MALKIPFRGVERMGGSEEVSQLSLKALSCVLSTRKEARRADIPSAMNGIVWLGAGEVGAVELGRGID